MSNNESKPAPEKYTLFLDANRLNTYDTWREATTAAKEEYFAIDNIDWDSLKIAKTGSLRKDEKPEGTVIYAGWWVKFDGSGVPFFPWRFDYIY